MLPWAFFKVGRDVSVSYVIDVIVACLFLLVSTHVFKNELCLMCGVLVLTHGTTRLPEIELCYMCVACLFRLMVLRTSYVTCVPCLFRLTVLRTSNVICDVLVLTHGTTRLPETPSESMCFQWIRWTPSDDFEPSSQSILYTSGFIL